MICLNMDVRLHNKIVMYTDFLSQKNNRDVTTYVNIAEKP